MNRRSLALLELPRASFNILELSVSPWLLLSPRGDGHKVFVIPGFVASDDSTFLLRSWLTMLGYETSGWKLGRNLAGRTPGIEQLLPTFEQFAGADGPVSLVGWSLGGVLAREIARHRPDLVRQVICLGSPLGHDPTPVQVPCTAIFSETDAVVPHRLARLPEVPGNTNISVTSSHLGLGVNPRVYRHIARALAPARIST